MDIDQTSNFLNDLLSQTEKKREKKVYSCFIKTVSSLKKRALSGIQLQLINEKLTSFNLKASTENRKTYVRQKHVEFRTFLKNEFSLTPKNHYTEQGVIYGMIFGTSLGLSIGIAIDPKFGTSIGLSIGTGVGMTLGMLYGARKDAVAKRKDKVF
ncbi:hypothetical protein [Patiriisocius sp. Uisw_017]|jgi:F0F1-type ATP synthase assembly protein I|uniref:hypothetical protein n=1 Tax=Patiriisocius sp. Uisw_017 TaxID=3230968 RepID=UPI0039EC9229